ncbi:type III-B CRISPR module RAMP protein Cmr1 [Nocardiopsis aegyptia]|uniref:CRISPR-associated protein Cmr1 n=1 Tax=Nocardiopsis aegyptia TaxID=220378 RepID=A0A7Z0EKB3_9ACTN|nr:type III-B CRISPR module RAMP protein Cmr1 [Nocardiopsis aegyptia]NYJ32863.1 CRISPR-associated protein Cmr1 [Nocardiopsis aegyptia]
MAWTTFRLTVTTPLFNGDDATTGLHASSIRGAMHHWFRALAATRAGNDVTALARAEQAVFGSTRRASPVRMRLAGQPIGNMLVKPGPSALISGDQGKWVGYLLGQGLTRYDSSTGRMLLSRPYTRPGHSFDLRLGFSGQEDVDALFLASLWLACTYGGFGARTRKGFGGVRLVHEDGDLPGPWREHSPNTPTLDHYRELDHLSLAGPVKDCADLLWKVMPAPADDAHDRAPVYPALGPGYTTAALGWPHGATWQEVASESGELYRRFRASRAHPHTTKNYEPKIKTPEHHTVVHGRSTHFPLGALGLPVNYQSDAVVNVFQGEEHARRASPLWLRFVGGEGEETRLFSFAFLNPFLPKGSGARIRAEGRAVKPDGSRPVTVDDTDVQNKAGAWLKLTRLPT